jgi:L-alanine-DL-glutamate epimerase-like enolase superfamily enzyme
MQLSVAKEDWPLARTFTIARGAQTVTTVVVVTLTDGEVRGHGESEPQDHYGESVESVVAQIEGIRLLEVLPAGAARNAVDCALWDLEAKRQSKSAWELAGLSKPETILTDFTISLDAPAAMHAQALEYLGWPILKLKLGGEAQDLERALRSTPTNPGHSITSKKWRRSSPSWASCSSNNRCRQARMRSCVTIPGRSHFVRTNPVTRGIRCRG